MAFELDGFNDAILGQLSQIGIEIFNDRSSDQAAIPKIIYKIIKNKGTKNDRTTQT